MTCVADLQPNLPIVNGDHIHLEQVLLNLALNALEAMSDTPEEKRRLSITSAAPEPGKVQVTVHDTGPGIAAERLPRLFESFFSTKKEGMGLGLSISRAIIEMHGGRIWAKSSTADGTKFHFTLPTERAMPEEASKPPTDR